MNHLRHLTTTRRSREVAAAVAANLVLAEESFAARPEEYVIRMSSTS